MDAALPLSVEDPVARPGRLFAAPGYGEGPEESPFGREELVLGGADLFAIDPRKSSSALRFGAGEVDFTAGGFDFGASPLIAASRSPIFGTGKQPSEQAAELV